MNIYKIYCYHCEEMVGAFKDHNAMLICEQCKQAIGMKQGFDTDE